MSDANLERLNKLLGSLKEIVERNSLEDLSNLVVADSAEDEDNEQLRRAKGGIDQFIEYLNYAEMCLSFYVTDIEMEAAERE